MNRITCRIAAAARPAALTALIFVAVGSAHAQTDTTAPDGTPLECPAFHVRLGDASFPGGSLSCGRYGISVGAGETELAIEGVARRQSGPSGVVREDSKSALIGAWHTQGAILTLSADGSFQKVSHTSPGAYGGIGDDQGTYAVRGDAIVFSGLVIKKTCKYAFGSEGTSAMLVYRIGDMPLNEPVLLLDPDRQPTNVVARLSTGRLDFIIGSKLFSQAQAPATRLLPQRQSSSGGSLSICDVTYSKE